MTATQTLPELIDFLRTRTRSGFAQSLVRYYDRNGRLTENQERAARGMMAEANRDHGNDDEARMANEQAVAVEPVTPGFYLVNGELWKAKYSSTGNLYAVKRTETGWEYVRGGVRRLSADLRVTPEQAAEHGLRTGICLFCNAELDDRDGLGKIVGVGPVCARKHLGMTQRQLADRIGAREAVEAPVAAPVAPEALPVRDSLERVRMALVAARREGRDLTDAERDEYNAMIVLHGPEGVYMDGELWAMYA